jgi:hypothetical protein
MLILLDKSLPEFGLQDRRGPSARRLFQVTRENALVGPGNHMGRHKFAKGFGGRRPGIYGSPNTAHIAGNDSRDIPAAYLNHLRQLDVRRLAHRVTGVHQPYQSFGFEQSDR